MSESGSARGAGGAAGCGCRADACRATSTRAKGVCAGEGSGSSGEAGGSASFVGGRGGASAKVIGGAASGNDDRARGILIVSYVCCGWEKSTVFVGSGKANGGVEVVDAACSQISVSGLSE